MKQNFSRFFAPISRSFAFFLVLSSGVTWAGPARHPAQSGKALVTAQEARDFCLKVWFPFLAFGPNANAAQREQILNKLMELYTEDAEFMDPNNQDSFGKSTLKGRAEIRRYYQAVLANYPSWEFEIKDIFPTERGFVLRYVGKNAPPVDRFEGVDVIDIERGSVGGGIHAFRIKRLEGFYDRVPFTRKP